MEINQFSRTELVLGSMAMEKLKNSRVAVFGLGGVGGHVVETLVRSGVGELHIIDNDDISLTNINRQIIATLDSVGRKKTEVMKERILSINKETKVYCYDMFFLPDTSGQINFNNLDYIVDAIDTVTGKLEIIMKAQEANVPVISSMGTGNKVNPLMLEVTDIYKTTMCPLAKVMRKELKKRNIEKLKVVYSREESVKANTEVIETLKTAENIENRRTIPGSNAFVPSVAGIIIASEVIKDIIGGI